MKTGSLLYQTVALAFVAVVMLGGAFAQRVQPNSPRTQSANGNIVCLAAQMKGNDIGAKVNACDATLGIKKGEIRLTGGGTISTQIIISSNHTLRVISGTYKATSYGPVIRLKDESSLICNSWDPVLQESTGPTAPLTGLKPFTIAAVYNGTSQDGPNGSLARNVVIKGCHFQGAHPSFDSASQTVALANCHNCSATHNWLDATRTIGIQVGGGSALGNYAQNVTIANNLLTQVASQNLAIVNSMDVQVIDNTIRAPGQVEGPGVVPIDVEPNVGDKIRNIKIANNLVDMTKTVIDRHGAKGLHGIAINNLNAATPFTGVEVTKNTIYGGDLKDPHNHVSGGLILVRGAQNALISNNFLRRGIYCVLIDSGSSKITVRENQLSTCGSGSSEPIRIVDSWDNQILYNKLWGDPANLYDFSAISRNIVELGESRNNTFKGNDAVVHLTGKGSRKISTNNDQTSPPRTRYALLSLLAREMERRRCSSKGCRDGTRRWVTRH